MERRSIKASKLIPFHSPLVTASVNYNGHPLLKLLIADNASQIDRINLLDIDYSLYQERIQLIKRKEDKIKELLQFIASKSHFLMVEPKPQLFIKDDYLEYKDRYEHQYPIEYLMKVPKKERMKQFMLFIKEGHILLTMVNGFMHSLYSLKFLAFDNGPHRYLYDTDSTDIQIIMPSEETEVPRNDSDRLGKWLAGTRLRVEVVKVQDLKICVGTRGVTEACIESSVKLGKISISDLPPILNSIKRPNVTKLSHCLAHMKSFQNPQAIKKMASQMNLDLRSFPTLMPSFRKTFPDDESASVLRKLQMCKWAHKSVADGVQHFKSGQHDEAFQCLTKALQIDPENVEAYVAKGALLANLGRYEKAVESFERALKYNPNHANARKYVCETLVELGKQREEHKKSHEAEKCYLKCLEINKDHEGCQDALNALLKKLNRVTNVEKITKKMEEDKFYSDLLKLEKELKAKKELATIEEMEQREQKRTSLSPLSLKLADATQSALWTCPPATREAAPIKRESAAPPTYPASGCKLTDSLSFCWDAKGGLKTETEKNEDNMNDQYNAMVEEFLKNITTRVETKDLSNEMSEKQTSKGPKKKRHKSSSSTNSTSSTSSENSSRRKKKKKK